MMSNRLSQWTRGTLAAVALVAVAGCGTNSTNTGTPGSNNATPASGGPVTLSETGSSLLYPLFNGQWVSAYKSVNPSSMITAASTGSGAGISQAIAGTVQIGASDAYMADAQMKTTPMLNIPVAISAQQIMYNLPGMTGHLKLTGDVIAKIFEGKIQYWDDAAIKVLNSGVNLPHKSIIAVHRTDGSGDTFLFTQFLTNTNSTWKNGPGYSTNVSWPVTQGGIGAKGNDGVVAAMSADPYSIGYVGISWLDKGVSKGLGYAQLQNQAGNWVLPTSANIQAAVNAQISKVPTDERMSLIYGPGANSYPIINFEYVIVNTKQEPATATALKSFLSWAIDSTKGNSAQYLTKVHFLPLPASMEPLSQAQINKIGG